MKLLVNKYHCDPDEKDFVSDTSLCVVSWVRGRALQRHIYTYIHTYVRTYTSVYMYVCTKFPLVFRNFMFALVIHLTNLMDASLVLCIPGRTDCPPHSGYQRSNVHDEIPDWTVQPWPRCIYRGRRCVMRQPCDHHVTVCDHHVTVCDHHVTVCDHHVTIMWPSCDHHVTIMWLYVTIMWLYVTIVWLHEPGRSHSYVCTSSMNNEVFLSRMCSILT